GGLRMAITRAGASSSVSDAPFVGREMHLQQLEQAFAEIQRGSPVTMYIHGDSGMGKTALVRHFLDDLSLRHDRIVILEGRCYERESVPFKAIDGVVDSLTRFLLSLPNAQIEALMPADVHALARLFPVMLQIDFVFNAREREREIPDPSAL